MNAWVICLLVICAVVNAKSVEGRDFINYGVLNSFFGPNPRPGCNPPGAEHKNPTTVNEYRRGCTKMNRCQRD
ncbi:PREDICTED: protein RALF-like 11 [Camelina sativa]|uniref:Protein RALF-like 11 n=1 Tax=Camelina sativa TaxID=90675 RepID=A0ABM1RC61_CAMSA|nr:PREDICTED: protein RALF-like 11 [Camelina sativa]